MHLASKYTLVLVQAKQNESKYIGVSNNDLRDSKDSFGSKDAFGSKASSGLGMLFGLLSAHNCLPSQPYSLACTVPHLFSPTCRFCRGTANL